MTATAFHAPASLTDALALLAQPVADTRVLAGGTDLVVQMRAGRISPARVIDLKRIPEMIGIRVDADGSFLIGAATPCAVIGEHTPLSRQWPGVSEAAQLIGSKQVQGRASLGGNLCNASPAADSVPALVAAGAVATLHGPQGRREVPVEQIPAGPGRTTLRPGEIVVCLTLPPRPPGGGDAYLRLIPRTEMDIAVVGCGVSLTLRDGTCTAARPDLALTSKRPWSFSRHARASPSDIGRFRSRWTIVSSRVSAPVAGWV